MYRFVIILLVCVGAAPFLPGLLEGLLGVNKRDVHLASSESSRETGERRHLITAGRSGHYYDIFRLNGQSVEMIVDTGATTIALPESVAEDIGINLKSLDYKTPIRTANGTTYGARTVIDRFQIGEIRLNDVDATVIKDDALSQPLLGMSVLNQLKRFDFSSGTLVLVQ